nr:helix-turn-helix domain-containing protein [Coralloluteibacterium stylophorae]
MIQARQMRGFSQRSLGDKMGMGKERGAVRINRYEHEVTAIGFESLQKMAETLEVPVSYLLADDARMADAILALSHADASQMDLLADLIPVLVENPALLSRLMKVAQLPRREQASALKSLTEKA